MNLSQSLQSASLTDPGRVRDHNEDGYLVADGGFAAHWGGLLFDSKRAGRSFVPDRGFASIGYGLPGAMGAAVGSALRPRVDAWLRRHQLAPLQHAALPEGLHVVDLDEVSFGAARAVSVDECALAAVALVDLPTEVRVLEPAENQPPT